MLSTSLSPHPARILRLALTLALGIALSLATISAPASRAATLTVPGSHATLQAALDAAQPGDTIQVAAGTYTEALVFSSCGLFGQPITLMGAPGDPVTPGAVPVIDTAGTDYADLTAWQAAGLGFDAATLHQDPLLVLDLLSDHYHLTAPSPAVDAVPGAFVPPAGSIDIDGGERRNGAAADLGADELGAARIFADGFELGDFTAWLPDEP